MIMLNVYFANVSITRDVFMVILLIHNGCVIIVLVLHFHLNHIIDDDEFQYSLKYFHNSVEYNKLLGLKLNPFVFEDMVNNESANNLIKS